MAERKHGDASVLAALPRSRPQRRSTRRTAQAPPGVPAPTPRGRPAAGGVARREPPRDESGAIATAIQATGELAAIGAGVAGRIVHSALLRLPGR